MPTLYIARHGNTFEAGETPRRIGRGTDLPLVASGRAQAAALGECFTAQKIAFDKIFSAPLKRTRETADAIAAHAAHPVSITIEPALLEIDYGPDENQPESTVIARIGAEALDAWNTKSVPPQGWNVDTNALIEAWRSMFSQVRTMAPDAIVLAVTSNGVARFALDAASTTADDFPKKMRTGAFGRIEIDDHNAIVSAWDVRP